MTAAQDRGPCQRVGEDPGSAPRGASANSGNPLKGSARVPSAATTERDAARGLSEGITLRYIDKLEAEVAELRERLKLACLPCAECGHVDWRELDDILETQ